MVVDPAAVLTVSILLRLFGVGCSVLLLYRVRDTRFGVLTVLLSLMTLRQFFTHTDVAPQFAELPGLAVSVLSVGVVYQLLQYTRQESDIKAQLRETNQRLREHRTRLEAIVSASPDDVFVFDEDGQYVDVFPDETLGGPADGNGTTDGGNSLTGRHVHDVRPDDVAADIVAGVDATRTTGQGRRIEYTLPAGDESRRYEGRTARVETPEGADRVLFVRRDVTDRWERERRLRRLSRAVEAAGAAIYITDRNARIQYANPAFEAITGYPEAEVLEETPRFFSSGAHDDEYYDRLWSTILSGDTWRETVVNERRSGERYHAKQTIAPVVDGDGEIEEFVAIQIDITGRKRRERQLMVLDRLLRHNLRNDLAVILGHAERIEAEYEGDVADSAALIREKGESLLANADKEREVVRLVTEEPNRNRIDAARICRDRVANARRDWPDATIDLDAPDSAPVVAIDELGRAIDELLYNAIEHCDRTAQVTVTVEAGAETVVRVADNGPGISEQERSVFDDFETIDALTHGSGVGLWLVYWTVNFSGGTLTVEDRDPRGSVVRLGLDGAEPRRPDGP